MKLLTTGFIQVYFVSLNTVFLANNSYLGVTFAAFMISYVWSMNVKKIAIGTNTDRLIYASGATLGSLAGLATSELFV